MRITNANKGLKLITMKTIPINNGFDFISCLNSLSNVNLTPHKIIYSKFNKCHANGAIELIIINSAAQNINLCNSMSHGPIEFHKVHRLQTRKSQKWHKNDGIVRLCFINADIGENTQTIQQVYLI